MDWHVAWQIGLTVFLFALALFFLVAAVTLGRLLWRVGASVHQVTDEVIPVIGKVGTSVDTVNAQLGKVDIMMDSAVDVTESVDTTVRAVSIAVTEPVKKVSGVLAGLNEGLLSLRRRVGSHDSDAAQTAHTTAGVKQ